MWANAFLLRKEQFFPTDTYEARWHTPLRGEWDLVGTGVGVNLPGDGLRRITPRFALVDTRGTGFVRVQLGTGWHPEEFDPRGGERWRWTKGEAKIELENPHSDALTIGCTLDGWSPVARTVSLRREGGELVTAITPMRAQREKISLPPIVIPPGKSTLLLQSNPPPAAVPGDSRLLGISVFRLDVTPQP